MKKKYRRCFNRFSLSLIIFSLLFFHFHLEPVFSLTTEEEKILGQKFLMEVRRHYKFVEDDFATGYINDLGRFLLKPVAVKPFPFRFYIIKDHTLNAFAAPGGHIFFFAGLIQTMDDADELAAVLTHEIAHVTARHLAKRLEQNKKMGFATMAGVLAGVLIGGKAGGAVASGSMAAGIQAQLHFSREDERQADQLGFKYMDANGLNPSSMITILDKIQKGNWYDSNKLPSYLLTHPTGPERMANLDSLLSGYTPKTPGK
ncbi:M48 family metallopeptidase [Thermodesulfobacteriota bacterium]